MNRLFPKNFSTGYRMYGKKRPPENRVSETQLDLPRVVIVRSLRLCFGRGDKKEKYVYYHCTGNKGKCPEKWVREEEIARQFSQVISAIKMDDDTISWVFAALKESHADEKKYHSGISTLQVQYEKLRRRLGAHV